MPVETFDQVGFPAGLVIDRSSVATSGSLLELQNGFVTAEGIIRSRSGAFRDIVSAINDGAGTPSTQVHSLAYHGIFSYFGVGTAIKRGLTVNIVTGLVAGTRTTFARMAPSTAASGKEFTYFANPTRTGTHGAATGDHAKKTMAQPPTTGGWMDRLPQPWRRLPQQFPQISPRRPRLIRLHPRIPRKMALAWKGQLQVRMQLRLARLLFLPRK